MSKKINKPFTKEEYQTILNFIKTENLGVIHSFDRGYPKGGMTIIFSKTNKNIQHSKHYNIVEVSTALCHTNDAYNKKIGLYLATKNWMENKRVRMFVNDTSLTDKIVELDARLNHCYW